MKLRLTITVQRPGRSEMEVFSDKDVSPDAMATTFSVVERTVRSTLAVLQVSSALIRMYVGPSLLETRMFNVAPGLTDMATAKANVAPIVV